MKLAYVTPNNTDPLAYYRGTGPLCNMRKNNPGFDFDYVMNDLTWATLKKCDAVFIQRPYNADHLAACELAKKWDMPLIGDFDDWLYELPKSNPAYNVYQAQKKNFTQIVNMLDRIIVATDELAVQIRTLLLDQNKPIDVVPNAYDVNSFRKYRNAKNVKEKKMVVAWRGGNSHGADIMSVKEDYRNLFKSYPEWQFMFIAQNPWVLDSDAKNVVTAEPLNLAEYFKAMYDASPALLCHPLEDNVFNRCKSMCSWLEATHARAAFIGPDFQEYRRPGISNYGADKSFFQCVSEILDDPQKIVAMQHASEAYILEHLTLEVVNKKRMDSFIKLLS